MIPGSSLTSVCMVLSSGRCEEGGGGGGEVGRGGREAGRGGGGSEGGARGFGCVALPCIPLPVMSFGGAMATNLTTPLERPLTIDSAVATSTPIREVSLMERRWSLTLREGGREGGREGRERGREEQREGGRDEGREGGREEEREGGRGKGETEKWRERMREGGREGVRNEEGREGNAIDMYIFGSTYLMFPFLVMGLREVRDCTVTIPVTSEPTVSPRPNIPFVISISNGPCSSLVPFGTGPRDFGRPTSLSSRWVFILLSSSSSSSSSSFFFSALTQNPPSVVPLCVCLSSSEGNEVEGGRGGMEGGRGGVEEGRGGGGV